MTELRVGDDVFGIVRGANAELVAVRESGVIEQQTAGAAVVNRLRRDDLDQRFPGLLDSVLAAA